jgi:L-ascorbate metabolism protein UlaG (beta-lactamase superfamily)
MQEARISYIGHATVLIEIGGMRILTDPILRDRIAFLRRRKYGTLDRALYQNIDAILLSHLHHDHLDPPSLKRVGADAHLLAPHGSAGFLRGKGMRNVQEMRIGDSVQVGALQIRATYADHSPQRHPFGAKADCLGYVIEGD